MKTEARRLHAASWIFIAAGTVRALILPLAGAVFASGGVLLARPELLSLAFLVPSLIYAFIRQRVYTYRFTESELIVRDGLLTRNVRTIAYDRIHDVALVRTPVHRLLGVTTARVETAAGGKAEALLRVLSLDAAEELRRQALGAERKAKKGEAAEGSASDAPLFRVPDRELLRLGLISNRGLLVVAAAAGVLSQVQWWDHPWFKEQDWQGLFERFRDTAPAWAAAVLGGHPLATGIALAAVAIVLGLTMIRVFSMAWYVVRYRGFTLRHENDDVRRDYGLWPEVSSVIPAHRIQLVSVSASLLARWCGRTSIDVETAGAAGGSSTTGGAEGGAVSTRQWLAPIIETSRASPLVRRLLPEIDIEGAEWKPIEAGAARRIVKRIAIAVTPVTAGLAALFSLSPIPLSGWHALWLPVIVLPLAWTASRQWVRRAGYALTDDAVYFRSGWLSRHVSAVRFVNIQTASMNQSPFDRRRRMASVAVDTAGAGGLGHRINIPYLDVDVAETILERLYGETRSTEFRW